MYFNIHLRLTSETESNNSTFGSETRSIFSNHHQNNYNEAYHPELDIGKSELLFKYINHNFFFFFLTSA